LLDVLGVAGPAPPLLPALVPQEVEGLPGGEDDQQPPQVVAVLQAREPAAGRGPAEGVEGAEGRVLLVGRPAAGPPEPGPGQLDQLTKVALPQGLGSVRVAGAELAEPARDRSLWRHGQNSSPICDRARRP